MKKKTIVLYTLLSLSIILLGFYFFKTKGLQRSLDASVGQQTRLEGKLTGHRQLVGIDSLLLQGKYPRALKAYREQRENMIGPDTTTLHLRIALTEQLMRYESERSYWDKLGTKEIDSSLLQPKATPLEIRKYDSLSFALEKAKVRLVHMERQLREKSFGEYLTFKNKKGSQMHYVGEVKDKNAHGYGIALLDTGSRYEGQWKENQRHGTGTFYWSDGEYYMGNYFNDRRNGEGTYFWPNGEKFTGQWKDDKRNGQGTFYGVDGEVMASGIWRDDKLVEKDRKTRKERK